MASRTVALDMVARPKPARRLFTRGSMNIRRNTSSSGRLSIFMGSFFTSMAAKGMVAYRHKIMGIYHMLSMVL